MSSRATAARFFQHLPAEHITMSPQPLKNLQTSGNLRLILVAVSWHDLQHRYLRVLVSWSQGGDFPGQSRGCVSTGGLTPTQYSSPGVSLRE